jgi:hypothetical protein
MLILLLNPILKACDAGEGGNTELKHITNGVF